MKKDKKVERTEEGRFHVRKHTALLIAVAHCIHDNVPRDGMEMRCVS